MRYALRNQQKVRVKLGEDMLHRMIVALDYAFANYDDIDAHIENLEDEPYNILSISEPGYSDYMIRLYVIRKQYDVYVLAFKEFMG